jgi:hypothetical protein
MGTILWLGIALVVGVSVFVWQWVLRNDPTDRMNS